MDFNERRRRWSVNNRGDWWRPLPPTPTDAMPGSEEKVAVMEWRWEHGYQIHHPRDRKYEFGTLLILREV